MSRENKQRLKGMDNRLVGVRFEWELGKNSNNCFPLAQSSGFRAGLKGERERFRTRTAGNRGLAI